MPAPIVRRDPPVTWAQCFDCKYHEYEMGTTKADQARQRAKAHARSTGHQVLVQRSITTYLNPRP